MSRTLSANVTSSMLLPLMLSLASMASAADLQIIKGEVLLSHGDGYSIVQTAARVSPGDTVVSRPDGSAKITFGDGCVVYLGMGMVFTVEENSPCGPGYSAPLETSATAPQASESVALASGDGGWGAGTETLAIAPSSEMNFMPYLLGAAAVGGVAVAVAGLGGGGNDGPPVSP